MAKFVVLSTLTGQGLENYKDMPERIAAFRKQVAQAGGEVRDVLTVLGAPFDTVSIVSAPSDEAMARVSLELCALGNVRTQTLRAFADDELKKIVK
jgi:uncharacterized protein with GYD domain